MVLKTQNCPKNHMRVGRTLPRGHKARAHGTRSEGQPEEGNSGGKGGWGLHAGPRAFAFPATKVTAHHQQEPHSLCEPDRAGGTAAARI